MLLHPLRVTVHPSDLVFCGHNEHVMLIFDVPKMRLNGMLSWYV